MNNNIFELKMNLIKTLEYCSIERAARVLECEVEDIEHYLITGAIDAYTVVRNERLPLELVFQGIDESTIYDNDFFMQLTDSEDISFEKFTQFVLKIEPTPSDIELSRIKIPLSFNSGFELDQQEWTPEYYISAFGLWKISRSYFLKEILDGEILGVRLVACDRGGKELTPYNDMDNGIRCWDYSFWSEKIERKQIVLLQHDILKLLDALYKGVPINNSFNNLQNRTNPILSTQQVQTRKVHGNAIVNSLRRQEIFEFAIYVKNKWPAQCANAVKWAKLIDEKAPLRWSTGEPPLSLSKIEEMLRSAVRDPKVCK